MADENAGLGSALAEAVSNLRDEPLLSFGIAVVIVIGIVATAGVGSWIPIAATAVLALAVLVAVTVRDRNGPELDLQASGVDHVARGARVQRYRGPRGTRVRSRLEGQGTTGIEEGAEVQVVEITTEASEPRNSP